MQILQWLFKVKQEEQPRETSPANKETVLTVKKAEPKDLVLFKKSGDYRKSKRFEEGEEECKDPNSYTVLLRRCNARTCFYSTLNLKRLGSLQKSPHWLHQVRVREEQLAQKLRMGHKVDAAAHVRNKVLPVCDATISTSTGSNDECGTSAKKEKLKGDRTRAISRMKELLRWAAAAKSEKGGKYISRKISNFRNRGALKATRDDNDSSSSSPKISFRWDMDSCSISSSAYSGLALATSSKNDGTWIKPVSNSTADDVSGSDCNTKYAKSACQDGDECTSRTGNWITTDDEFVVLEL